MHFNSKKYCIDNAVCRKHTAMQDTKLPITSETRCLPRCVAPKVRKSNQVNVRLFQTDAPRLVKLCAATGVSKAELLPLAIQAGLDALETKFSSAILFYDRQAKKNGNGHTAAATAA